MADKTNPAVQILDGGGHFLFSDAPKAVWAALAYSLASELIERGAFEPLWDVDSEAGAAERSVLAVKWCELFKAGLVPQKPSARARELAATHDRAMQEIVVAQIHAERAAAGLPAYHQPERPTDGKND